MGFQGSSRKLLVRLHDYYGKGRVGSTKGAEVIRTGIIDVLTMEERDNPF